MFGWKENILDNMHIVQCGVVEGKREMTNVGIMIDMMMVMVMGRRRKMILVMTI